MTCTLKQAQDLITLFEKLNLHPVNRQVTDAMGNEIVDERGPRELLVYLGGAYHDAGLVLYEISQRKTSLDKAKYCYFVANRSLESLAVDISNLPSVREAAEKYYSVFFS